MRKLVVSTLLVALVILGMPLSAETPQKPNMFDTSEQCNAALVTGNFSFYQPKFFNLKEKTLGVNGTTRVLAPLERNACVHMLTTAGRKWIPQEDGTMFRAHRDEDNNLAFYAREDCGNPVFGVSYPKTPAPQVQEKVVVKKIYIPVPAPPQPQRDLNSDFVPMNLVVKKKSHTVWYVIGGIVLVGGIVALASGGGHKKEGPVVTTLPPCTSSPCN